MIFFVLFFAEVIILFLLSRLLTKSLSGFLSIQALSFLFLPGIIIHELSHLLVAAILFVPVGNIDFTPKKSGDGERVRLGSVEIAKTDPVRRVVIGFAPIFVGILIIIGSIYLFSLNISFLQKNNPYIFTIVTLAIVYLVFAISNTMFSSNRDMEGALEILITLLIIFGIAYVLGFRFSSVSWDKILTKEFVEIFQTPATFLLIPIFIDLFILGAIKTLKYR